MQSKFQLVTNVVYKINQLYEILTLYWHIKNSKYLISPQYSHDFCNTCIHLAQDSLGFQHGARHCCWKYILQVLHLQEVKALHVNPVLCIKINAYIYVYVYKVGYTHIKKY